MARYTFYIADNKVTCVTHYAGKEVKGIAKCDPNDTFDSEYGRRLAQARADKKVAIKRYKAALKKKNELKESYEKLAYDWNKAENIAFSTGFEFLRAQYRLQEIEEEYQKKN